MTFEDAPETGLDPVHRAIEIAWRYLEVDRYELALQQIEEGLQADPRHPGLWFLQALALDGMGRREEALEAIERALALDPLSDQAHGVRAMLLTAAGRHSEAEASVLEALQLAPQVARHYLTYARLTHKVGQLDKAEQLLERGIGIDPDDADLHRMLAHVQGEARFGGQEAARLGMALEPGHEDSHAAVGMVHYLRGRPFAARRVLRDGVRLDPGDDRLRALWLEADRACRITFLPLYYFQLLCDRLPGRQFAVWGAMLVLVLFVLPSAGASVGTTNAVAIGYVAFCLYTWVAGPITSFVIKLRPPR